jgi:hypothetical protein
VISSSTPELGAMANTKVTAIPVVNNVDSIPLLNVSEKSLESLKDTLNTLDKKMQDEIERVKQKYAEKRNLVSSKINEKQANNQ